MPARDSIVAIWSVLRERSNMSFMIASRMLMIHEFEYNHGDKGRDELADGQADPYSVYSGTSEHDNERDFNAEEGAEGEQIGRLRFPDGLEVGRDKRGNSIGGKREGEDAQRVLCGCGDAGIGDENGDHGPGEQHHEG